MYKRLLSPKGINVYTIVGILLYSLKCIDVYIRDDIILHGLIVR